jgi:transposase
MEERRLEAGRLLQAGEMAQANIARHLGLSRWAVNRWARRLRPASGDLAALKSRPKGGRPPRMTAEPGLEVLGSLGRGATAFGFETERGTLQRIHDLVRQRWGVASYANSLAEKLRTWGWSPQGPAVTAKERDEQGVRDWRRGDWPRLKKRRAAERRRSTSSPRPGSRSAPGLVPRGRPEVAPPC